MREARSEQSNVGKGKFVRPELVKLYPNSPTAVASFHVLILFLNEIAMRKKANA